MAILALENNVKQNFMFQVGLMVEEEVRGVAREVDGEEEGVQGGVEAREEFLLEGITIREQNTTAEILCYQ